MQEGCLKISFVIHSLIGVFVTRGFRVMRTEKENVTSKETRGASREKDSSLLCSPSQPPSGTQRAAQHARITYQHSLPFHSIKE
jgi:hypothetical protein